MSPDRSNNLNLKYQRFTPSGCKDIGIRKFEFLAQTQFPLRYSVQSPYAPSEVYLQPEI